MMEHKNAQLLSQFIGLLGLTVAVSVGYQSKNRPELPC